MLISEIRIISDNSPAESGVARSAVWSAYRFISYNTHRHSFLLDDILDALGEFEQVGGSLFDLACIHQKMSASRKENNRVLAVQLSEVKNLLQMARSKGKGEDGGSLVSYEYICGQYE